MPAYGTVPEELEKKIAAAVSGSERELMPREAAVLIPLLFVSGELCILFEERSDALDVQPGEVCFPGGSMDPGETPEETARRETCEELLLPPDSVRVIGRLHWILGPNSAPIHPVVGLLSGYGGSFSEAEVKRTFTVPVAWFIQNPPAHFTLDSVQKPAGDFPLDRLPGGKDYRWRPRSRSLSFYLDTDPLIWGATARMTEIFIETVKDHL